MRYRIRWKANDYGTVRRQLMVIQSCTPLGETQRVAGVLPSACLLLHTEGESAMRAVLAQIDAVEALGIAASAASPTYRQTLANRLLARLPLNVALDMHLSESWRDGIASRILTRFGITVRQKRGT